MSTTMAKPGMERKWYIIDAAGQTSGPHRCCTPPSMLRGKHKPDLHPPC